MKANRVALVALAAAVVVASVAAASPEAAKQRVAITSKGVLNPSGSGVFQLTTLQPGALVDDSGTQSSTWSSRVVIREGQSVEIEVTVETLEGKRGSLVLRGRTEHVDAGYGYTVGTSTWKVLRGTGQYANVSGGGRGAAVTVLRQRRWSGRYEGFLTVP